jgi:hypothetical protein
MDFGSLSGVQGVRGSVEAGQFGAGHSQDFLPVARLLAEVSIAENGTRWRQNRLRRKGRWKQGQIQNDAKRLRAIMGGTF